MVLDINASETNVLHQSSIVPECNGVKVYCLGTGMENKGAQKALVIELRAKSMWALQERCST